MSKKNIVDDDIIINSESQNKKDDAPSNNKDSLTPAQMHDLAPAPIDNEKKRETKEEVSVPKIETDEDIFQIDSNDIGNRKGNYIFTIGNISSGKSTLQNLMVARLWNKEDIELEYIDKDGDHRHSAILNSWVEKIKEGVFPDRTLQERTQEFNIAFSQTGRRKLELNFIEISGENIRTIIPQNRKDGQPKLGEHIDRYLRVSNKQIRKRFIFVSDSAINRKKRKNITAEKQDREAEDVLFNHFLRYLLGQNGLNMQKIDVLFVISKWDLVADEYDNNTKEYVQLNFPQTRSIFNGDRCNTVYMPFSVGMINEEDKIIHLESKYIDRIINWIYYTYTDNTLKGFPKIIPSWLDKIARSLNIS